MEPLYDLSDYPDNPDDTISTAEYDKAIAERDALRDDNIRTAGILGKVMRERDAAREQVLRLRDACESVAQNMEASGKLWTPWHTSITVIRLRDALDMTAPQDK